MIFSIIIAILSFGLIIFIHELGHFITAKKIGVLVHEFAIGMGPKILSFTKGETTYALRLFPIGGFVSMEGEDEESENLRSFGAQKIWKRAIILVSGAAMNLLLGFILSLVITLMNDRFVTTDIIEFHDTAVTNQWLVEGDEIYKIDGRRVRTSNDLILNLMQIEDGKTNIEVIRNGEKILLKDVTFQTKYEEEIDQQMVQLDFYVKAVDKTILNVLYQAFFGAISIVKMVWYSLLGLLTGLYTPENLSGPIGITQALGSAFNIAQLSPFLNILMMLTINLGVLNLLPFPALDGGRVVFLIIEKIIRRPVPAKYEDIVNGIGLLILLGLSAFVAFSDIRKLFI